MIADTDEAEQRENSVPEALRPYAFPPGTSGNYEGRPKGSVSLSRRLKDRLERHPEEADEILRSLLFHAYGGDAAMMKLLFERHDGPLAIKIEGLSEQDMAERLIALLGWLKERLPAEYHPLLAEGAREVVGQDGEGA